MAINNLLNMQQLLDPVGQQLQAGLRQQRGQISQDVENRNAQIQRDKDARKQKWANALYLLGGALKGNDMSQDMNMLQQSQQLRTARDNAAKLNASIDNNPNLNASQKELAKANLELFAKYQFESQFGTPKQNTAKVGSLWKDQDTGTTFRELITGDTTTYQSPKTGLTYSLEEMREYFPGVRPTTAGEPAKYYESAKDFKLQSSEILTSKQSIDRANTYLDNLQKTPVGAERLFNQISTAIKTIAGENNLTETEVAQKLASGNLQGLVGSNRLEIAGPGVLTEQDWARILEALGGNLNLLQNPSIVFPLISEIISDKTERYNEQVGFYNAAVRSGNYDSSFKEKEFFNATPRKYLPDGIPQGSKLINIENNIGYYESPEGEFYQHNFKD